MKAFKTIDAYIKTFPGDIEEILQRIRATIHKAAPKAEETIKYGIPTFVFNGNLVHFGGFKNHIGFFPGSSGVKNFQKELLKYKTSKGTIQFQLNEPIPYALITKITKFRVKENLAK
ncbi:MAG: DUF1801 domain-containing protein [Candidatus Doudnabacteria bacterium]|nr:DUF1801 domain-containing protein [Candidatus Doudnabacteria bacterium]